MLDLSCFYEAHVNIDVDVQIPFTYVILTQAHRTVTALFPFDPNTIKQYTKLRACYPYLLLSAYWEAKIQDTHEPICD